jgi:gliding motility-associated-like protein
MIKIFTKLVTMRTRFTLFISLLFLLTIGAVTKVSAQCTGVSFKLLRDTSTNTNVKKYIEVDADSGCKPYSMALIVKGYSVGTSFKFYIGKASPIPATSDTFYTLITKDGYYDIKIELINSSGNVTCTLQKDSAIKVGVAVSTNVYVSNKVLCNGASDSLLVIDSTQGITDRTWLQDGSILSTKASSFYAKFTASGCHKLEINLKQSGCSKLVQLDSFVCIYNAANVDFTASKTSGCKAHVTSFTPSIGISNATVSAYNWSYGGATPATDTGAAPGATTYGSAGAFSPTLTITTNKGCTYTKTKTDYINVGDTFVLNYAVNDTNPCSRQKFIVSNTTVGLPATGGSMDWTATLGYFYNSKNAAKDSFELAYIALGKKTIKGVYTYNGCSSKLDTTINVIGPASRFSYPAAGLFKGKKSDCDTPSQFSLDNITEMEVGGLVDSFVWKISDTFPGGYFVPARTVYLHDVDTPTFTLSRFGNYTVRLITYAKNGCVDSISQGAYLSIFPPIAKMEIWNKTKQVQKDFCACDDVFLANKTNPFSSDTIRKIFQVFFPADTLAANKIYDKHTNNDTVAVNLCTNGKYLARMFVYTDKGCLDTAYDTVMIGSPTVKLSMSNDTICKNDVVVFTDSTSPALPYLIGDIYIKNKDSSTWASYLTQTPDLAPVTWSTVTGSFSTPTKSFFDAGVFDIMYIMHKTNTKWNQCGDSIVYPKAIVVSNMEGNIKASATYGCIGTTIKFDTTGIINQHFGKASNAIRYEWIFTNATDGSLSTQHTSSAPKAASTNVKFLAKGVWDAQLMMKNSDSCSTIITVSGIDTIGVVAAFDFTTGATACAKAPVGVTNSSLLSPDSFVWSVTPATKAGKPVTINYTGAGSYSQPIFTFPDSGTYSVRLIARRGACRDTLIKTIQINTVKPKFAVSGNDTFNCAPGFAKFVNTTVNTGNNMTFQWYFGDSAANSSGVQTPVTLTTFNSTDTIQKLYKYNRACFSVSLIATSVDGCVDTFTNACAIKFLGPIPIFSTSNRIGCEPLVVNFGNASSNVVTLSFDFGDGSKPDTSGNFKKHTYTLPNNSNQTYQEYFPKLTAYDANNCVAIYPDFDAGNSIDTIRVYKKPLAYFYADTTDDCEPFCIQFHDSSKYATVWNWDFGDGSKDSVQHPVHCFAPGTYTVKLKASNGSGCADSTSKTNYIKVRARSKPAFTVNDSVACQSISVNFSDKSTFTDSLVWDFGNGNTSKNKNVTQAYSPGSYTIKLYTNNQYNCKDSLIKDTLIRVFNKSKPVIHVQDSVGCEPFTTTLIGDSSMYADSFIWVVTKGATVVFTSTQANPAISLTPGTYSVGLRTSNLNSCADSVTKINYITVYDRARPSYTLNDSFGCDTVVVNFTSTSQFASTYLWNFGDGKTSSTTNPVHGFGVGAFDIKLWANNANNCPDSITTIQHINVVNKPRPVMWADTTRGCDPFTTVLHSNLSQYDDSYKWDFDTTDAVYDVVTSGKSTTQSFLPGSHYVKLVATNNYGCADSITNLNYITVYEKPVADFQSDKQSLCYKETTIFSDYSAVTGGVIVRWLWDYGDTTFDTIEVPNPHVYNYPGNKTIALYVVDNNGCRDTTVAVDYIFMDDSIPPVGTEIQYVTVNDNGTDIDVYWNVPTDPTFFTNKLHRGDPIIAIPPPFTNIYSTITDVDTHYNDPLVFPPTKVWAYTMTTADSCGWESAQGIIHQNIVLAATTLKPMTNLLTWTPYVGWSTELKEYQIHKYSGAGGTLALYRTLAPTDTSFIDSLLCDSDYFYRIVAVHNTQGWESKSNEAFNHPPFINPDTSVSILKATVLDDQFPYITWKPSAHAAVKNYIIDRYDSITNTWNVKYAVVPSNVFSFTDINNLNVHAHTHSYRVNVEDYCGNYSPSSNDIGRTILLDAFIDSDVVHLQWTPYVKWQNGVKEYQIQIQYDPVTYKTVHVSSPSELTWVDDNVYEDLYTNYCYRIVAIEDEPDPLSVDTSTSNLDCAVVPSRIFVPNAFTPNGKGPTANEIFKPTAISVYTKVPDNDINDYQFIIYNRWGQSVFETHEVAGGWDGTVRGTPCPDDLYQYVIKARGRDGYAYNISGTVHLIR